MKYELTAELYHRTIEKVHAPDELLRKVENMKRDEKKNKKGTVLRRAAVVAAAVIVLFIMSNLVALAATGSTWVGQVFTQDEQTFWYDAQPNRPMENVREFFVENGSKFDGDPADARRDYYGGTYVDNGVQVILLTDLSHADAFTDVDENIRFERCDYTYAALIGAIRKLDEIVPGMIRRGEGYAPDIVEWELADQANRVSVGIYHMTDEKVQWFKENVLDEPFLVFCPVDSLPEEMID